MLPEDADVEDESLEEVIHHIKNLLSARRIKCASEKAASAGLTFLENLIVTALLREF